MRWRLCPECELNYIQDGEKICKICSKKDRVSISGKAPDPKKDKPFPQICTIINQRHCIDAFDRNTGATGYKIFGKNGDLLGVVLSDSKYTGRAVIRFLNKLKAEYGVWHLIQENYSFLYLQRRISEEKTITINIE